MYIICIFFPGNFKKIVDVGAEHFEGTLRGGFFFLAVRNATNEMNV